MIIPSKDINGSPLDQLLIKSVIKSAVDSSPIYTKLSY